jgi:O-antigen/teichoic acid export membrane protein
MSNLILVKNAFANLCRGGAAALVTLLLPPFLTQILSKDAYGTWLLILQLSTYVSFLDFGIQTAVGRYVAHHNELGEFEQRDSIVSTSLMILTASGAVAVGVISLLAWQLPNLFKDMPIELHQDARLALLFVGISLAIALPFNVFGGIFIGIQRYDIPAWIIGTSKLLGGIFVIPIAYVSHSLVMMGLLMGMANLLTGLWQYFAYRKIAGDIKISLRQVSKSSALKIADYCSGLLSWSMGTILVSGLDTAIVGYFHYQSVVYYTLAASVTNFVTGIQGSIFTTMLPSAATIGARGDREGLGKLLISSTRYATITLIITSLPLILGGKYLLTAWVGENYAANTILLMQLLIIANFIRQLGAPYAIVTMAVGEQKLIMLSPIIEGIVNVSISIVLVNRIGVVGVAIGTITGGLISVLAHLFYNLPRTKGIKLINTSPLISAVCKPLTSIFPAIVLFVVQLQISSSYNILDIVLSFVSLALCILILHFYVFTSVEKEKLALFIKYRMEKHFS